MAIEETLDEGAAGSGKAAPKKSSLLLIILLVVTTLLLVVVSVAATLYFTGALSPQAAMHGTDATFADSAAGKKDQSGNKLPPLYVELGEPLVVNFVENNQIRYLQVQMEVMTRDPELPDEIKTHLPLIRNNLLLMLSDLDFATISSFTGKQKIRAEALAEVQSILKEQIGKKGVEELYFTTFVMQ